MMNKTHAERLAKWKAKSRPNKSLVSQNCINRISAQIDAVFYGHKKIIRDKFL